MREKINSLEIESIATKENLLKLGGKVDKKKNKILLLKSELRKVNVSIFYHIFIILVIYSRTRFDLYFNFKFPYILKEEKDKIISEYSKNEEREKLDHMVVNDLKSIQSQNAIESSKAESLIISNKSNKIANDGQFRNENEESYKNSLELCDLLEEDFKENIIIKVFCFLFSIYDISLIIITFLLFQFNI